MQLLSLPALVHLRLLQLRRLPQAARKLKEELLRMDNEIAAAEDAAALAKIKDSFFFFFFLFFFVGNG